MADLIIVCRNKRQAKDLYERTCSYLCQFNHPRIHKRDKLYVEDTVFGDSARFVTWKPKDLIEHYPCLNDFGFIIEPVEKTVISFIRDENGKKIRFERTVPGEKAFVELKDFDELLKLIDAVKNPLVIGEDRNNKIEIYDGYRE